MSNLTVKRLLHRWLAYRLASEQHPHIAYHQMPDVVKWAQRNYNVTHAPNTYERKLREIINKDYPHRFTDVSKAMGKRHSVWLLLPPKQKSSEQTTMFKPEFRRGQNL